MSKLGDLRSPRTPAAILVARSWAPKTSVKLPVVQSSSFKLAGGEHCSPWVELRLILAPSLGSQCLSTLLSTTGKYGTLRLGSLRYESPTLIALLGE